MFYKKNLAELKKITPSVLHFFELLPFTAVRKDKVIFVLNLIDALTLVSYNTSSNAECTCADCKCE